MTTQNILFGSGSKPASNASTPLAESTSNPHPVHLYDLREGPSPAQTAEEFDIEDYIATLSPDEQERVSQAGKWVASTLYEGQHTLATIRLNRGLSQQQLADICGMKQPHISRYESGKHEPTLSQARRIATALGVTLDELAAAFSSFTKTA